MRGRFSIQGVIVAIAIAVIVLSTIFLTVVSYRYTVGPENLAETTLVQSNMLLANQYVDRIEQKIIDNDRTLAEMVDVEKPSSWPAMVEAIKNADLNVEQVYVCRPGQNFPLFPSWSYGIRNSWGAFLDNFKVREIDVAGLAPGEPYHLHKERPKNYFFATYVLKEDSKGNRFLVCFQMSYDKVVAMLDRYLRDLQGNFYVSIVDYENNGVYNDPISRSSRYYHEKRIPTTLYKWYLQIVPRNYTEIEKAVRSQRRWSLFLIILSMALIFLSLGVIYGAGRRERQLRQLKEDFISSVSHELKTPLSLISMFSELLQTNRVKTEEARREYYDIIQNEARRMSILVKNLLDFASLEKGERARHFEMTDIAQLVSRELEAFEHQVRRETCRITSNVHAGLPETAADPTAISMALLNFLDNSVKFTGENKDIRVGVTQQNGFIEISVADNGPGIPLEERGRIFEKFYRGSAAVGGKIRGSGLGLAIARHVADLHGGEVMLESEVGKGSVFTLRIPLRSAPENAGRA